MTEENEKLSEKNTQLEAEKTTKGPVKRLNPNQQKEQEELAKQAEREKNFKEQIAYLTEQKNKQEEDIAFLK